MEQEVEPQRSNRRSVEELEPLYNQLHNLVIHESLFRMAASLIPSDKARSILAQLLPSRPQKEQQAPSNLICRASKPREASSLRLRIQETPRARTRVLATFETPKGPVKSTLTRVKGSTGA